MDVAYDQIQEKILPQDPKDEKSKEDAAGTTTDTPNQSSTPKPTLNSEFQEAYKTISTTPWGAKLGGFFSSVQKSSSTFYDEARQEATAASGEAVKGFQGLRASLASRARSLSGGENALNNAADNTSKDAGDKETSEVAKGEEDGLNWQKFRAEAAKRLKDLEKAEEAADAAIFRFGANLGSFLKDAVTISAPSDSDLSSGKSKVLFESKGADGKRVIHSTRLEAQLHAIHTTPEKFEKDPEDVEGWGEWKNTFGAEKKTGDISKDLERYEELRRTQHSLVPTKVEYKDFWRRYYFLRMIVEREEQRRKEVLKGASLPADDDHISWDDDSDSETDSSTPQNKNSSQSTTDPSSASPRKIAHQSNASQTTLHASHQSTDSSNPSDTSDPATSQSPDQNNDAASHLKPAEGRRSQDEKSQADSDASYDLVSGATSKSPGSPRKDEKGEEEDDWE